MARAKTGLTQIDLAKKLGISYPTLNKYERGHRVPDAALLSRMAKFFRCDPGWLLTGESTKPAGGSVPEAVSVIQTPVISKVPDDFPEHVSEEINEYISLPDIPGGAYSVIVKGESMSPTIREGDYAIFMPYKGIGNGDIVLVNDEWGDSILRRYRKKNKKVLLISDNPEYPMIEPDRSCKIIGKVIAVWRKIRV